MDWPCQTEHSSLQSSLPTFNLQADPQIPSHSLARWHLRSLTTTSTGASDSSTSRKLVSFKLSNSNACAFLGNLPTHCFLLKQTWNNYRQEKHVTPPFGVAP